MNAISIKNANLYLGRKQILFDINLNIKKGQHAFILGPNGAGKTTLTRMLLGYLWPKHGAQIEVLGNTYGNCDISEVRKKISWISPYLLNWVNSGHWTVRETVLSGKDSTIGLYRKIAPAEEEYVVKVLEKLNIERYLNKKYNDLSSGEQVKVLIAKALYSKSEIMILDEACVHLDIKSREQFLSTVKSLADSKSSPTIIFVTQRIEDLTSIFDYGYVMKNGSVVAEGQRSDILTENKLINVFELPIKLVYSNNGRVWPIVQ
jgi:iron complex transport system ATP-binding protein